MGEKLVTMGCGSSVDPAVESVGSSPAGTYDFKKGDPDKVPQDTNICIIEQPTESTLKYAQIIDGVDSVKDLELVRGTQKGECTIPGRWLRQRQRLQSREVSERTPAYFRWTSDYRRTCMAPLSHALSQQRSQYYYRSQ